MYPCRMPPMGMGYLLRICVGIESFNRKSIVTLRTKIDRVFDMVYNKKIIDSSNVRQFHWRGKGGWYDRTGISKSGYLPD